MRKVILLTTVASSLTLLHAVPANAQSSDNEERASGIRGFEEIIVTARRQEESLQSVPVAVSVLGEDQFKAQGAAFSPNDMSASVPSLGFTGGGDTDRTNVIFTLRGQSFTYGALFPSVITYFNEVPTKYLSIGQFYDAENLQILRGPQGVQFGRVTNGGNVMLAPKKPTKDFSADITFKAGNYALKATQGFLNVPLVDDTLMLRFAWDAAERSGFTKNVYDSKDLDDLGYYGGRLGILFQPSDRFENYLVAQYQRTSDHGTAMVLRNFDEGAIRRSLSATIPLISTINAPVYGIDPVSGGVGAFNAAGTYSIPVTVDNLVNELNETLTRQNALGKRKIFANWPHYNERKYLYLVNTMSYDITDNINVKNILGYTRYIERSAQNYAGDSFGYVRPCHGSCPFTVPGHDIPFWNEEQLSAELRFSGQAIDDRLTWSLGGYLDKQRPAGPRENDTISGGILEYALVQRATTKSRAAYGYAEFSVTDQLKVNGGIRYTKDTVHSLNQIYLSLLPVPGLADALFQNFAFFRDNGFGFIGLDDPTLQYLASATANSASQVQHGVCAAYNAGIFTGGVDSPCLVTDGKFTSTTWTIGTSYQFNPQQLVYAKYSKGYRPGGVNATYPAEFADLRAFAPENNFSLESGIKSDWDFGGVPLRTNIAVYYDRYKKIQQVISVELASGAPGSVVTNAANARVWGIEIEGSVRPAEGLNMGLNYSYTNARFKAGTQSLADVNVPGTETYLACNNTINQNFGFCNFNSLPGAPKHQLGVNFHWDFIRDSEAGTFGFGGNWYMQSKVALSSTATDFLSPRGVEPSYNTLNLNANWNNIFDKPLDLFIFVTNVTDETHAIIKNVTDFQGGIGILNDVYNPPRMWGAAITAHF